MTVLQILKQVLRRLREPTVASLDTSTYSTMVCDLMDDIHREMLDAHMWHAMDRTVDIEVSASDRVLDLSALVSGGGNVNNSSYITGPDSQLRYDSCGPLVWVFDSSTDTEGVRLIQVSEQEMHRLYQTDRDQTIDDPCYFSLSVMADGVGQQMTIWPPPTSTRWIRAVFWIPEDVIDATADDSRVLLVPTRPLILGTLMLALNERGEEVGEPGMLAERRYYSALAAAIEADTKADEKTNVYEYRRD